MPDEKGQGVGGWSESVPPHSVWLSRVNFKAQFPAQVKSRVAIAFGQQQQQQWQEQQVNAFKSYVCFALLCFLSFFLSSRAFLCCIKFYPFPSSLLPHFDARRVNFLAFLWPGNGCRTITYKLNNPLLLALLPA